MPWVVQFLEEFEPEFHQLRDAVKVELLAGDKSGVSEARFYRDLIAKADLALTHM